MWKFHLWIAQIQRGPPIEIIKFNIYLNWFLVAEEEKGEEDEKTSWSNSSKKILDYSTVSLVLLFLSAVWGYGYWERSQRTIFKK